MFNKQYWFFGSKLNTALLFVLIILMIIAINIMLQDKVKYFSEFQSTPIENTAVYNVLGNKDDLVFLSILPNTKVHGILFYSGSVKGGYFFEGNILINILDANKNVIKKSNTMATTDWMTSAPVSFKGSIDFTGLPKGSAYFEIHNDNASGLSQNDKSILIPIVIE